MHRETVDPASRTRVRRATPWCALAVAAAMAGCGAGASAISDRDQIRTNLSRYGSAVLDGDGAAACSLMVGANRRELARASSDGTCEGAMEEFQALLSGDAKRVCAIPSVRAALPAATSVEDCVREMQTEPQLLAGLSDSLKELDGTLRDAGARLKALHIAGADARGTITVDGSPETIRFKRIAGTWLLSSPEVLTHPGSEPSAGSGHDLAHEGVGEPR